jgi:hypothetical protein
MRRVFSMEAEGISKFWKMKAKTNIAMTKTEQMEARASRGVSSTGAGVGASMGVVAVVVNGAPEGKE